jgi:hypothetical protein
VDYRHDGSRSPVLICCIGAEAEPRHSLHPGFLRRPRPVTGLLRRGGVSDPYQYVGDYTNPILKPEAAQTVKKHGEIEISGLAHPTPSNHCWPSGVPYIFFQLGVQIL